MKAKPDKRIIIQEKDQNTSMYRTRAWEQTVEITRWEHDYENKRYIIDYNKKK